MGPEEVLGDGEVALDDPVSNGSNSVGAKGGGDTAAVHLVFEIRVEGRHGGSEDGDEGKLGAVVGAATSEANREKG